MTYPSRARADWQDFPDITTPILADDLDQWDQAIYELKNENTWDNDGPSLHLEGNLSGLEATDQLIKQTISPTFSDGTNGVRGNSIITDAANTGGHSSWSPLSLFAPSFVEKGSNHLITAQAVNTQGASDSYNELMLFYGNITANRKGALTEGAEILLTANQAARTSTMQLAIADQVVRATYASTLGASSGWARTGARGLWIRTVGSHPPTGIYLDGDMDAAIDYAPTGSGTACIQTRILGEAYPRMKLGDTGLLFSPGSSTYDVSLSRIAAGVAGFNGAVEISSEFEPAAGAANTARVYARDNGSGKTQLCVRFATGAVQVLATEP